MSIGTLLALCSCNSFDFASSTDNEKPDTPADKVVEKNDDNVIVDDDYEYNCDESTHWFQNSNGTKKGIEDHKFVQYAGDTRNKNIPASCDSSGVSLQKCTVCGYVHKTVIPALSSGHEYAKDSDGNDIVNWTVKPTCTSSGYGVKTCLNCDHTENVNGKSTGHNFGKDADGNDLVHWTVAPTCTVGGTGVKVCTNDDCGYYTNVQSETLGHEYEEVLGITNATDDKSTLRLFHCIHDGCDLEYVGFKASDVTSGSKATLKKAEINGKTGFRFFGHPVGNDVSLDSDGSADSNYHPEVYNKNQKGDYFEFVFDLTAQQAAILSSCKLNCIATPAEWMQYSQIDFWKVKGDAANDWTFGMYIDDAPEHQPTENADGTYTGVIVQDFRYLLYVDDVLQTMDDSIDTPAGPNESVGEYYVPFTFHLHAGTNKIRLVMAGGYRSIFYNFLLVPCEAE